MFPHNSTFLAIPVAVLLSGPLIMEFLTGYQRQFALHFVALPVELERYTSVALVLGDRKDFGDLFTVKQQLTSSRGVSNFMGAGRIQRHNMAAQQERFAVAN